MREMFLYPWDVLDAGVDAVADHLTQWHIKSVSLAGIYHQARMLLPHNPIRRLMVHPSSSCYFPFDEAHYGALVPRKPLADYNGLWLNILNAFSKRGISVTSWCVLLHSSYQCSQHPDLAITSIYGDHSPSNLCPSHPEVQDYVSALACDLKRSGIDQMDAESLDYAGFLHGDHHEMYAYADTASLDQLLGLCFCKACQAQAKNRGIDVEALKSRVRAAADAFLLQKPIPAIDNALFAAYSAMRCDTIAQLAKRMQDESGLTLRPILGMTNDVPLCQSGVDLFKFPADKAIICYPSSPDNTPAFVSKAKALVPKQVTLTGGVRLMNPQTLRPDQVSAYEAAYAREGISHIIYYNYGMAPLPILEALRSDEP